MAEAQSRGHTTFLGVGIAFSIVAFVFAIISWYVGSRCVFFDTKLRTGSLVRSCAADRINAYDLAVVFTVLFRWQLVRTPAAAAPAAAPPAAVPEAAPPATTS
jgi:hypothetical protein